MSHIGQPIMLELNGETVAWLTAAGWQIDWAQAYLQGQIMNVPRDCWIAQLLMAARREGAAGARDGCPGCAHEPEPARDPEGGPRPPHDPRQAQQRVQQLRALADYLNGTTGMPQEATKTARGTAELARAILAPARQQTGLRASLEPL